jgi:hypothetical protein
MREVVLVIVPAEYVTPSFSKVHTIEVVVIPEHDLPLVVDVAEVGHAWLPSLHRDGMAIGFAVPEAFEKSLPDQRKAATFAVEEAGENCMKNI